MGASLLLLSPFLSVLLLHFLSLCQLTTAFITSVPPNHPQRRLDNNRVSTVQQIARATPKKNQHFTLIVAKSTENNNEYEYDEGVCKNAVGTYRPFAEHAWFKLLEDTDWFVPDDTLPPELSFNKAPAKGFPEGSIVRMEAKALRPAKPSRVVRYARYALLETLVSVPPPSSSSSSSSSSKDETPNRQYNSTAGIQVLNLVIFPSENTNLPVFGADLVSLPGDKHLLLLDAQPMEEKRCHQHHWKDWYRKHVIDGQDSNDRNNNKPAFAWGGDIPEPVAKYVSDYALWTRLVGGTGSSSPAADPAKTQAETEIDATTTTTKDPITQIQTQVWDAYRDHLDLYLELLSQYEKKKLQDGNMQVLGGEKNGQEPYIEYRLNNDPAKPMLKSLFGEEFTERLLQEVLFPELKQL